MLIVFHRRSEIDVTNSKTLCGNVTSSTKPEVHNVAQRCRRRNEARVEVRPCGFPDIRADRQTNRPTDILITILRIASIPVKVENRVSRRTKVPAAAATTTDDVTIQIR